MHGCLILQRQKGVPPCNLIAYRHRRGPGRVHWYLQDSKHSRSLRCCQLDTQIGRCQCTLEQVSDGQNEVIEQWNKVVS